jgi:hypothetical protein
VAESHEGLQKLTEVGWSTLLSMEANQADAQPAEPLYAAAKRIYPQSVKGTVRRIKWILHVVTLGTYYLLPFLRWQRGLNAPTQAILVDLLHRRFDPRSYGALFPHHYGGWSDNAV